MSDNVHAPHQTGQPLNVSPAGQAAFAGRVWQPKKTARRSMGASLVELATSLSGIGLTVFMLMHLGLLSSVLFGAQSMNDLASFLERYYLLQAAVPFVVLLLVVHVVLTGRRAPTTFREQLALFRQLGRRWHMDTWLWAFQLITAGIILVLAAIHLWVVLTDIPIKAEKSAGRIDGVYLWLYLPFVVAVEGHISAGIYRVLVKWGLSKRLPAHLALAAWTPFVLGLGFAILATFHGLDGAP